MAERCAGASRPWYSPCCGVGPVDTTISADVETAQPTGSDLRTSYRSESLDLCRRAARTACILWIAVTPAFVVIDFARFPELAPLFLVLRVAYVAANLGLLALLGRSVGTRRPREIALAATALGGLLVLAPMSFTGGHASPYVNGMALLILGMALLMPWSPSWSILATALLVASYVLYTLVAPAEDPQVFLNNIMLFAAAGLIGAVSTSARERLRWREFKNRAAFAHTFAEKCASESRLRQESEANRRLIAALDEANRVRSQFVSTMSHELRTPLNVILGLAEMARDPEFDAAEREQMLTRIEQAGTHLLQLIEATLEVGNLESGRWHADARVLSTRLLWSELLRGCADLVPQPGVTLIWDEHVPDCEIRTDPGKLAVVLRNLLGNALKFTSEGWVRVRMGETDDGIELVVQDTGIGIHPDDHALIFEMYRQADSSETRRFSGCGLGLYIVQQFVQRLGGSVRLESEPGKGSTFTVALPRERVQRDAPQVRPAPAAPRHAA